MVVHILILLVVLFFTFYKAWNNEFLKSLFFTVWFIIVIWINMPSFVNASIVDYKNYMMLPYILSNEGGIFYVLFANILLSGILLFLQARFSNNTSYTYKEIKKMYDNFSEDATELYIIGRDLDFLYKDGFEKQTKRITHLGNKCRLLCESTTNNDLLNLYKRVGKDEVEVRFYDKDDNITNLKGQIKIDQSGFKKAIFTSKIKNKYLLLNIENQFLVSTLMQRCSEVYTKSSIPA